MNCTFAVMKAFSLLVVVFILFSSCEKRIEFNLKNAEPVLNVDASIENGKDPVVVLTKSLNFFSTISIQEISNSLIKDAKVFISNGVATQELNRIDVPLPGAISYSYYSFDPALGTTRIQGELNTTYELRILWNGKEYKAVTTIPAIRKTLDSIWWEKAPFTPDTSTKVVVKGTVTDPPEFGNYIRYFTKVNDEPFFPGLGSVFDDLLVNGTTYEATIDKGVNRNSDIDFEQIGFFRKGDNVTIKLCNIDKATYDFWRTVEFSYSSIGNPFSSPTKIKGNISNGALGYFGGYAAMFKSLTIPR